MGGSIIRRILSVSLSPVSAVRAGTVQTEVAPLCGLGPVRLARRRARAPPGLCILALAAPTSDVKMVHNYDHAHPNTEMSGRAVSSSSRRHTCVTIRYMA